jgi:hypothetical protein
MAAIKVAGKSPFWHRFDRFPPPWYSWARNFLLGEPKMGVVVDLVILLAVAFGAAVGLMFTLRAVKLI